MALRVTISSQWSHLSTWIHLLPEAPLSSADLRMWLGRLSAPRQPWAPSRVRLQKPHPELGRWWPLVPLTTLGSFQDNRGYLAGPNYLWRLSHSHGNTCFGLSSHTLLWFHCHSYRHLISPIQASLILFSQVPSSVQLCRDVDVNETNSISMS